MDSYTFAELLGKSTVAELKADVKALGIDKYSKLRKAELIERIREVVFNQDSVYIKFLAASDSELKQLEEAIQHKVQIPETALLYNYWISSYMAFADKDLVLQVPIEVAKEYEKRKKDKRFLKERERTRTIEQYALACTKLYMVIDLASFVRLINEQTDLCVMEEEIREWCYYRYLCRGCEMYFYQDGYLMADLYGDSLLEDEEDYREMLEKQKEKPYYIPKKEELLQYADDMYVEENPAFHQMLAFFRSQLKMEQEIAYDICADIQLEIQMGMQKNQIREECVRAGATFTDGNKGKQFERLLESMFDHTRLPENRGHTRAEIREMEKQQRAEKLQKVTKHKKIYPNDPCPCGSGKKYKRCCGRR